MAYYANRSALTRRRLRRIGRKPYSSRPVRKVKVKFRSSFGTINYLIVSSTSTLAHLRRRYKKKYKSRYVSVTGV